MKKILLLSLISILAVSSRGQFVARMEIKDNDTIRGLCDRKNVYMILPMLTKGQTEAVCPMTEDEIEKKLNEEVQFLKDHPDHEDKGILGIVINCKGEVRRCEIDNKTKSPELDAQIEAVFKTLVNWQPAKFGKKAVDSSRLFGFDIVKGKIKLH